MGAIIGAVLIIGGTIAALLMFPKKAEGEWIEGPTTPSTPPVSPSEDLPHMAERVAKSYGLEAALVKAFIATESSWDPKAINPNDPSYGILQVTIPIALHYRIIERESDWMSLLDPETGMRAGCAFLAYLFENYEFDKAVQCYNLGETRYNAGKRVPDYLAKIKRFYNEYRT